LTRDLIKKLLTKIVTSLKYYTYLTEKLFTDQ